MMRRFSSTFWTDGAPPAGVVPLSGPKFLASLETAPELCGPLDETACATVVPTLHPAGRPVGLFVPEGYEPNYAYPLLVWLHGTGGDERDLIEQMPGISTRNCFGLSLRGPRPLAAGGYSWPDGSVAALEREISETVRRLRREYHIHSERIFLGGFERGAALALELLLRRPEWFGGAAALAGSLPQTDLVLSRYRELQGKRVLLMGGVRDAVVPADDVIRTSRLLHAAGLDVTLKISDADHTVTPRMLSQINRWIIDSITAAVTGDRG